MNEMLERLARHICCESPNETDYRIGDDGMRYPPDVPHWMAHVEEALGILDAIREPTKEMTQAPNVLRSDPLGGHYDILNSDDYAKIWRQMIDEALK